MTFFYDLNKKLAGIGAAPAAQQLNEDKGAKPDFLDLDKDGDKSEPMKKAAKEVDEASYSAKAARAGKDIGKPGKNFEKIAKSAGERYGSKAAGERVAGAVLNKLRGKNESVEEGAHSQDAMALNPDFARVGKKPGVMGKIARGVKKVADFVAPGDEDLLRDLERKTGGRRPAKVGEATKEIPGGRRHTSEPGGYGRKDDEDAPRVQTQRGRGRPKKNADSETGEVMKPDWSAFGVGKVNLPKHKGAVTKHKMVGEEVSDDDREVLERLMDEAFADGKNALGNAIQGVLEMMSDEEQVNEKAVSKKQQKFMGMVHAAQKGEKPASKEVAKVAREMPKKEATKFASTKHKGLPEKVKEEDTDTRDTRAEKAGKKVTKDIEYDERVKDGDHGKKRGPQDAKAEKAGKKVAKDIEHDEKVDETTTSGSVATAPAAGGSKTKGGVTFGKGIYDSYNREVESMISESMNVSVNLNSEPGGGANKSITVTATDQDADTLASLLKMAGLGSGAEGHSAGCAECGQEPCDCEHTMEEAYGDTDATKNDPDYPTNQEYSSDALQYSGGLNKPKTDVAGDGQSTGPVTAVSTVDKEDEQDELDRMMEAAGIKKAKPDYIDLDKDGDKSEPMKKAAKDAEEKVDESIFSSTRNLWKTYKA